jgi:hypothetical protein
MMQEHSLLIYSLLYHWRAGSQLHVVTSEDLGISPKWNELFCITRSGNNLSKVNSRFLVSFQETFAYKFVVIGKIVEPEKWIHAFDVASCFSSFFMR